MSTDANWPDPNCPGEPMFPERDGKHVFEIELYPGFVVWEWSAKNKEYGGISYEAEITYSPEEMAREYKYVGPALTPAQITEMLAAERERTAKEAEKHRSDANPHAISDWDVVQTSTANDIAKAIRKLGAAP
ncbi:hypothetical protein [Acetobacter pasteurianus]|uniref:hypothetical protein n=1 Tax=Acetobacter pasteurianus TaxID=438 RepID=UPI0003841B02|nr:hypothetical protein [Acetobacter pasteurianus]CCT58542.1 hypothetical protein APA386B_426 [Acetobacter pasteurianus 386B]